MICTHKKNVFFFFCLSFIQLVSLLAEDTLKIPAAPEFSKGDPAKFGTELKEYLDQIDSNWKDEVSVSKMILRDSEGRSVQRSVSKMVLEKPDGDKSLIRFRSPAEIKGVAALTHQHPG